MTWTGTWPGRSFFLGRPAAATGVASVMVVAVLVVVLG
jgi:hypothetical protein